MKANYNFFLYGGRFSPWSEPPMAGLAGQTRLSHTPFSGGGPRNAPRLGVLDRQQLYINIVRLGYGLYVAISIKFKTTPFCRRIRALPWARHKKTNQENLKMHYKIHEIFFSKRLRPTVAWRLAPKSRINRDFAMRSMKN